MITNPWYVIRIQIINSVIAFFLFYFFLMSYGRRTRKVSVGSCSGAEAKEKKEKKIWRTEINFVQMFIKSFFLFFFSHVSLTGTINGLVSFFVGGQPAQPEFDEQQTIIYFSHRGGGKFWSEIVKQSYRFYQSSRELWILGQDLISKEGKWAQDLRGNLIYLLFVLYRILEVILNGKRTILSC